MTANFLTTDGGGQPMMRRGPAWLGLVVCVGLGTLLMHSAIAEALEWREEVALQDGGIFDGGRPLLVTMAQAATDYDRFGCPTPPYIAFRYDAGEWVRIPVAELPSRFVRMNLYPDPDSGKAVDLNSRPLPWCMETPLR
jgi:hypothetical protein